MKPQEVFNKIGIIIQELNEQYQYLKTIEGRMNDLDLELFVANAHFLADNAEVLRKLNYQHIPEKPVEPTKEVKEEKYFEPLVRQQVLVAQTAVKPVTDNPFQQAESKATANKLTEDTPAPSIDLSSETPADSYSYIRQAPETIRHKLEVDESGYDAEEQLPGARNATVGQTVNVPAEQQVITPVKPAAVPVPAVKHDESVLTINQKIAAQLGGGKQNGEGGSQAISDLKSAITLNEKLRFIKDLFNGYSLAYSEAIELLNRFSSFDDAHHFLKTNYIAKNNWESKPETTEMFFDLLKRRYL